MDIHFPKNVEQRAVAFIYDVQHIFVLNAKMCWVSCESVTSSPLDDNFACKQWLNIKRCVILCLNLLSNMHHLKMRIYLFLPLSFFFSFSVNLGLSPHHRANKWSRKAEKWWRAYCHTNIWNIYIMCTHFFDFILKVSSNNSNWNLLLTATDCPTLFMNGRYFTNEWTVVKCSIRWGIWICKHVEHYCQIEH